MLRLGLRPLLECRGYTTGTVQSRQGSVPVVLNYAMECFQTHKVSQKTFQAALDSSGRNI